LELGPGGVVQEALKGEEESDESEEGEGADVVKSEGIGAILPGVSEVKGISQENTAQSEKADPSSELQSAPTDGTPMEGKTTSPVISTISATTPLYPIIPPTRHQIKAEQRAKKQLLFLRDETESDEEFDNDEEKRTKQLRNQRKKAFIPPPQPSDENPDYMACSLEALLSSQALGLNSKGNENWTLFLKVPGQYLVFILEHIPNITNIGELKVCSHSVVLKMTNFCSAGQNLISKSSFGKDRPLAKMKLAFYLRELSNDTEQLNTIDGMENYSTLLLLRKKDDIDQAFHQVFHSNQTSSDE